MRRIPRILAALLLGAGVVAVSACEPSSGSGAAAPEVDSGSGATGPLGLTAQRAESARSMAYTAVRRYTDFAGTTPRSHTERFTRVGDRSAVEILTLRGWRRDQLVVAADQLEFDRLAERFRGGQGRFIANGRDFQVRDLGLLRANYSILVYDEVRTIAGRGAHLAEVKPRFQDRPSYLVWLDAETFVTLKYAEFLATGQLAAEMEVLEIDYDGDAVALEASGPGAALGAQTEIAAAQAAPLAGFDVLAPLYLPRGFALVSTRIAHLAGHPVLAWSYVDGVQELFMVQYAELEGGTTQPVPPVPPVQPVRVGVAVQGAATDVELALLGTQIHVTAKLEAEEVMTFVEGLDLDVR